jgi:hypothetical protein
MSSCTPSSLLELGNELQVFQYVSEHEETLNEKTDLRPLNQTWTNLMQLSAKIKQPQLVKNVDKIAI